jgi:hypothetical protein
VPYLHLCFHIMALVLQARIVTINASIEQGLTWLRAAKKRIAGQHHSHFASEQTARQAETGTDLLASLLAHALSAMPVPSLKLLLDKARVSSR